MANSTESWTQRIGGNRTLVLGIIILVLLLFTVEDYVSRAMGLGSRSGTGYIQFTVNGRVVEMDRGHFQSMMTDWLRYQNGMQRRRAGQQDFLMDLMLSELATDAGFSIPDESLREYIRVHPNFADASGDFDLKKFDDALASDFGGMRAKAFEEQARLALLITHFVSVYDQSYRILNDEETWNRWKADYPKVGVVYAWSATSAIRAAMKPADVQPADLERYWASPTVQDRHRVKPRYTFEAAAVTIKEIDDQAYLDARKEWKDDPELQLKREGNLDEGFDYFFASRRVDFATSYQTPEIIDALRAENAAAVKAEDDERIKAAGGDPLKPAPTDPNGPAAAPDLSTFPPEKLDDKEVYRRFWRFRVEKELWLRKLMEKAIKASKGGEVPLKTAVEAFSRPGLRFRILDQDEPVDQYAVERLKGFGSPNCDLRYLLNDKKQEDEGKTHGTVLYVDRAPEKLDARGWVIFRLVKYIPDVIPALETVKNEVVEELLDDRARDKARADLEDLRKTAEDSRRPLEEVAKEKGFETAVAPPFNAYSWRPPSPKEEETKPATEARAVLSEGWKDPNRRLSSVMGRYAALRETPVGSFGPVLEDYSGSGAWYLAQVKSKEEPAFEEMNQNQRLSFRRIVARDRSSVLGKELSYPGLKNRLALQIDGKPAPELDVSGRER